MRKQNKVNKKKVLVLFQDWNEWFISKQEKFLFWFDQMDGGYDEKNEYYVLVLGTINKKFKLKKYYYRSYKSSSVKQFLHFFKYRSKIKKLLNEFQPDAIYVPFLYLASLIPKSQGVKKIGFLRDRTPEMVKASGGIRYFIAYIFYFLDYIAMKKVNLLFYNAKDLEVYAKNMRFKNELLYSPRDITDKLKYKSNLSTKEIIKKYNLGGIKDKKIILTVARLSPEKNIEMGILAMKNLPKNYIYLIIGEGIEKENLLRKIKELELDSKVFLVGNVLHEKIWNYYVLADCFWLLSKNEGTPNVLQEAFYTNTGCVVSNIQAMKDIIVSGENGIILKSWLPEELAEKTKGLIEDKSMYLSITKNANMWVKNRMKQHKKVKDYFNFFAISLKS